MENKRWHKQVPGGVLIEDDGGFINFFPSQPAYDPGMCLGFGMDDEEDVTPVTPETKAAEIKDNVIDFMAYKRKKENKGSSTLKKLEDGVYSIGSSHQNHYHQPLLVYQIWGSIKAEKQIRI